ncbi:Guanylate cyclase, partial [Globisporangium splendens]
MEMQQEYIRRHALAQFDSFGDPKRSTDPHARRQDHCQQQQWIDGKNRRSTTAAYASAGTWRHLDVHDSQRHARELAERYCARDKVQEQRSSSISSSLITPDRHTNHRSTCSATATSLAASSKRVVSSQVIPDGYLSTRSRSSLERSRDSSASRAKALSEFNIFLKILDEVAIHCVTLYFISITSSTVITKMEQSFTKYYANSQRRLYLRGLTALLIFMVTTFAYDYLVLWEDFNVSSSINSTPTTSSKYVGNTKIAKFTLVVALKVAIVLPVISVTYFRARKHSYTEDFYLTWACIAIVASYPLAYNKVTNDYGVSWVCLVIMYIYSCTPIRFFPCSVFCLTYLMIYVTVMLAYIPGSEGSSSSSRERISNETMYAYLFFFLIESYMSELMVLLQQEQLKMEETRSKSLLNSMLPESIVVQLQSGRELIADAYAQTTVLFAEVCDFGYFSSKLKPQYVVELLNIIFYKFDKLVDVHHVHKVETIGAVYMVVGGCPDPMENHAELVANLVLDMIRCIPEVSERVARKPWGELVKNLNIRIGINSGTLMAGVVGIRNPRFKLFGDTVNVASRMETTNLPGQIHITETTHMILCDNYFTTHRGKVFVKGRGEMNTYFLRGKGNYIIPYPMACTLPSANGGGVRTGSGIINPHSSGTLPSPIASPSPTRRATLLIQMVQTIPEDAEGGSVPTTPKSD